jgi:hypothetical protein
VSAIESLLAGLIDYAGLYPPAALDMHTAVRNYADYGRGRHSSALGRFLVDVNRLTELREVAGDSRRFMRLSMIASPSTDWDGLAGLLQEDPTIESIEIKIDPRAEVERVGRCIPAGLTTYFEVPLDAPVSETLTAIEAVAALGARVKLRMGGVVAGAFPTAPMVARMIQALADRRLPFKATAGLHHPIRSRHALTYEPDSPSGIMHGFLNLACSAALLYFGGDVSQAILLLEEQDPSAWQVTPGGIGWRSFRWSTDELRAVRERFMTSFGSCSFTEPIHDLEVLGWL